mgnify:FL=1
MTDAYNLTFKLDLLSKNFFLPNQTAVFFVNLNFYFMKTANIPVYGKNAVYCYTTCLRLCDMNAIGDAVNLQASQIALISHERKQVVNQYLYLHFPTQSMFNASF